MSMNKDSNKTPDKKAENPEAQSRIEKKSQASKLNKKPEAPDNKGQQEPEERLIG